MTRKKAGFVIVEATLIAFALIGIAVIGNLSVGQVFDAQLAAASKALLP